MFRAVKQEIAKFKDQLGTELAPIQKIDECLKILKKEYALNETAKNTLKISGASAGAGVVTSAISQQNSRLGLFGKVVAVGGLLISGLIFLEREIRPISTLPLD